jgi:hypothetical protein
MRKWLALLVLAVVLALGYLAAGPFIAINSIRGAIERQDMPALEQHIDFPSVRRSIRAQIEDYWARRAGPFLQASPFGAVATKVASEVTAAVADVLATPAGIGAVLQGRSVLHRISGSGISKEDTFAHVKPRELLESAEYRYESTSRFTATVRNGDGDPVVFVFAREGLQWRVTDVRLPLETLELADVIRAVTPLVESESR